MMKTYVLSKLDSKTQNHEVTQSAYPRRKGWTVDDRDGRRVTVTALTGAESGTILSGKFWSISSARFDLMLSDGSLRRYTHDQTRVTLDPSEVQVAGNLYVS